jgi:hypothetical protein
MVDEHLSDARAGAIVAAARRYRDAFRHHLALQTQTMEEPERFNALVEQIWLAFRETERAEEALFTLLDALDAQ